VLYAVKLLHRSCGSFSGIHLDKRKAFFTIHFNRHNSTVVRHKAFHIILCHREF